jgi:recombinational DNA repair protein (RecF pathway)
MSAKITEKEAVKLFISHDLKPMEPFTNTMTPWKSQCLRCRKIVSPKYNKVRIRGHQCAYCAGTKITNKDAEMLVRKIGHEPLEPFKNALAPWKMKCGGCGKTISPRYNSLQQGRWGCGYCGHERAGKRKRELSAPKAEVQMKENGLIPLEKYPGSSKPWKSRCVNCDSLVAPRLSGILQGQGGCTKCGIAARAEKRKISQSEANRIAKKLMLEPLEPYKTSANKWKCKCNRCGDIVYPRLNTLRRAVYGCSKCAGKIVDISSAREKMLKAGLTPLVAYPGRTDKGWLCKCNKCGREVSPSYSSIKNGQGGCIWCAGKKVDPVIAIAELKKKGLQPLEPFTSAQTKWKSKCLRCNRTIHVTYKAVSNQSGGCPFCAPNYVNRSRINEVVRKAGFKPLEPYKNASNKWRVIHIKCGREIKITYDSIRGGHSCKYCAGLFIESNDAESYMLEAGIKPLIKYPGAKYPWKSKCLTCNRTIYPQLSSVKNRNSGCEYCTGHKVDIKDAKATMKSADLLPLEEFKSSKSPWKCKCLKCQREVSPSYSSIRNGQGGCRYCADWGIDYTGPGFIYLMENRTYETFKLGIGGVKDSRGRDRIRQHEKHGWKLLKKLSFEVTDDAFMVEQEVLKWVREDKGLPIYLSELEMPQGGYTETVNAGEISSHEIWNKVLKETKKFSKSKKED